MVTIEMVTGLKHPPSRPNGSGIDHGERTIEVLSYTGIFMPTTPLYHC